MSSDVTSSPKLITCEVSSEDDFMRSTKNFQLRIMQAFVSSSHIYVGLQTADSSFHLFLSLAVIALSA
ncbi:hypothetical protein P5673_010125 [Acropora cervicornis]|uniref:Uncharacterized protein n=1 Tax=Acropora cervicornis TaxID=6130 RepID=A0AAD9QR47_ACRCE|nr:hypothetical protein P5673_010125 [Acropora cervicornis]